MSAGVNESLRSELEARLAAGREAAAYRNYEYVRDWLLDLDRNPRDVVEKPSEYWTEELETFDYLLDASPLVIEKLRQHTYPVTGIRAYDYRRAKDSNRVAEKLAALVELGGEELLVPESPALGGFGFEIDGGLYNIDTLKYYEALIALKRGAVVGTFAATGGNRRIVWEIGAGWGGFPYQFKSLFPDVTYVISDLPELFLFSATYLMTVFPDARTLLLDPSRRLARDEWVEYDFVFVPNTALEAVSPPHLDLTVNMVSFQEMTADQVESYVRTAYELGSPYVYSLNRERSLYNRELDSVSEILGRYYWPRVVPVLPVSYSRMPDKKPSKDDKAKQRRPRALDYKHVIATRRIAT